MDIIMESDSDISDDDDQIQDLEELEAVLHDEDPTILDSNSATTLTASIISSSYSREQSSTLTSIEAALVLNQALDDKYKKLEKILLERLRECRIKLEENAKGMASLTQKGDSFRYYCCGKPYFKDRNNIPAPDNEDTIIMKRAEMYDFSNILTVPGWTVRDKNLLMNAIRDMSVSIRRDELLSKIASLQRDKDKDNRKEIALLKKKISNLKKKSLEELALPMDQDYDWDAIAQKLHKRHSPQEFKALWRIFCHPSINKGTWTRAEHLSLQKIALDHNLQDWDAIAAKHNSGRTAYQCFVYYRSNLTNNFSGRKWSYDEMEYLKRLVDFYREDNYIPWGKVASAIENRTKIQVYNKYLRLVEQRKGRFLTEEDSVILNFVNVYGQDFKRMSQYLPGRSATQLRTRYNLLTKIRLSITWSLEDDRKLLQIMANQDSNSNFSTATIHFPGKDRIHIRSRYITLQKWMKNHPNSDLSAAPRRAARRLQHGQANSNLKKSIEALASKMKTEVNMTKERKKNHIRNCTENDIEESIMVYLYNEMLKEEANPEQRSITPLEEEDSVEPIQQKICTLNMENLKKVLTMLSSSLDRKKFMLSTIVDQYPGLANPEDGTNIVKVKSYSKKQSIRTIEVEGRPDVWGNIKLKKVKSVLPPNLSTITGCRVLMNHLTNKLGSRKFSEINLAMMTRHNPVLKEHMTLLKQRFKTLFLWPIMLSNRALDPDENSDIRIPGFEYLDDQDVFDKAGTSRGCTLYSYSKDTDDSDSN